MRGMANLRFRSGGMAHPLLCVLRRTASKDCQWLEARAGIASKCGQKPICHRRDIALAKQHQDKPWPAFVLTGLHGESLMRDIAAMDGNFFTEVEERVDERSHPDL